MNQDASALTAGHIPTAGRSGSVPGDQWKRAQHMDTADVDRNGVLMYDGRSGMYVVPTETGWSRLDQTSAKSDVGRLARI